MSVTGVGCAASTSQPAWMYLHCEGEPGAHQQYLHTTAPLTSQGLCSLWAATPSGWHTA
jgi:hypothetical protein